MDAITLTSIAGVAATAVGGVVIPWYSRYRRRAEELEHAEVLNWSSLNQSIAKERDDLRKRLDEIDEHYLARVKELREDWENQMGWARGRIKDLEGEVTALQRALRNPS